MNSKALIPAAAALMLAACSTTSKSGMIEDSTMGEAIRTTFAAQVIDPDPQYEFLDPPTSGEHAAQAVARYRTDKVKKPERVSSTQSVGN
ncbi:MAG: hypothetical protein Q8R44_13790 [Novosphingobium sp.]|nr:hypothetical protein [Novosphingobium sp.]